MSDIVTLKATRAPAPAPGAASKLRKQGLIPGRRVRAQGGERRQVAVTAEELDRAIRVQHARVLDLDLDGKKETVLIRELQWDHLGKRDDPRRLRARRTGPRR